MVETRFEFCPFAEELIPFVLNREPGENTVFVFPNENSVKHAIRAFQQSWQFTDTRMITIEELKNRVFLTDQPLLREEKRTLAFYASLTQADKNLFKIRSYFQSIELAQHFFSLWEEFNDECIGANAIDSLVQEGMVEFLDWQIEQFRQLVLIRDQYRAFISARGFSDNLFIRTRDNISHQFPQSADRFVFVNQFYYSRLEKEIIETIRAAGKEVVLYYQLPEELLDKESLQIKPFRLTDLLPSAHRPDITLLECGNDFSTMIALMETLHNHPDTHIIDPAFSRNPWAGMVSPERFNQGDSVTFTHSTLYRFFSALYTLMDAIIYEEKQGHYLLPLSAMLDAVHTPEFISYFLPDKAGTQGTRFMNVLYNLIDNDYKYIGLEPTDYIPSDYKELVTLAGPVLTFLQSLRNLTSLQSWIDLVDAAENGISIRKILNTTEHDHTNLAEVFYRLLADLQAIESIGIVSSWDDFFNIRHPQLKTYKSGSSLLRIMLDYMKAKTFHWNTRSETDRFEISSLNDTRNINYSSVAVLNVVEGKIPSQRITPFLFTDKQRQHMHLKTWDDIRQREHYYFSRLVLTTPQVFLFTMKNMEKNIEVSSFIEEFRIHYPSEHLRIIPKMTQACGPVYQALLNNSGLLPPRERVRTRSFYRIPLVKSIDFPDGRVKLSYTSFRDLKKNPMLYFIRDFCRVNELTKTMGQDFSARMIGNIAHDAVTECWRLLNPDNSNPFEFVRDDVTEDLVLGAVRQVEQRSKYYYSILHDYTYTFFETITRPNLASGILGFFDQLVSLGLGKTCYIYPEEEASTREEMRYKTLLPAGENALALDMAFRGRADLRIIDPDDKMIYIFDFKTGQFEREQLLIYELFYHLLEHPDQGDGIHSAFYQLFKNEYKKLEDYLSPRYGLKTRDDLVRVFKEDLQAIANNLAENGFTLPSQKSKLGDMPEITRKDLFLAQHFEETPA